MFNKEEKKGYREILETLFNGKYIENLSDYYLLNYSKDKKNNILINDIDFVPLFRFYLEKGLKIKNVFQIRNKKDGEELVYEPDLTLLNIFDFERIVVKGGDLMYQLILKYRQAFYDYIYKSKRNALNIRMFDEILFTSILSNIHSDKVEGFFSSNYSIKRKLNIWFSLSHLFNDTNNNINC